MLSDMVREKDKNHIYEMMDADVAIKNMPKKMIHVLDILQIKIHLPKLDDTSKSDSKIKHIYKIITLIKIKV